MYARRRSAARLVLTGPLWLVLLAPSAGASDAPSLESQIIFGTTCSRCHEGECSGRLSFDHESDVASTHIQRYAGSVSRAVSSELFGLLERMKRSCSFPPPEVSPPADGVWAGEALASLCLASQQSCLIPLGELGPGSHRLVFVLEEGQHLHAEVVTPDFEMVLQEPLEIAGGSASARFRVAERASLLLRLRGDAPIRLEQVRLERAEPETR